MDRISKQHRSWNMSRIRGENTAPERRVRSILHRLGFRFRLHHRGLPGRPDIVLARFGTVIFVHGCFWHRHSRCKCAYTPKTRTAFWRSKFAHNIERDRRVSRALRSRGLRVLVVWECQSTNTERLSVRLARLLRTAQDTPQRARQSDSSMTARRAKRALIKPISEQGLEA
jgi:DNA mismatch endonuclease, patch repair protein